jgi:hypothetical protein
MELVNVVSEKDVSVVDGCVIVVYGYEVVIVVE